MTAYEQPGEEHSQFMQWAVSAGIEINGIAPAVFPNKGLGMVTTRVIEVSPALSNYLLRLTCLQGRRSHPERSNIADVNH